MATDRIPGCSGLKWSDLKKPVKIGRPITRKFTPKQKVKAIQLRAKGVTRRRIAIDLGIDYQLLCSWLRAEK